jgi:hypothetical protein
MPILMPVKTDSCANSSRPLRIRNWRGQRLGTKSRARSFGKSRSDSRRWGLSVLPIPSRSLEGQHLPIREHYVVVQKESAHRSSFLKVEKVGDEIGYRNVDAYNQVILGYVMGYKTPNVDLTGTQQSSN